MKNFLLGCSTIFVGIPLSILFIYASLNYSGFCFAQMRYLSNEDKFRKLFEVVNQPSGSVSVNGKLNYEKITYENFEQFIESNPDCCMVEGRWRTMPSSFLDRITGFERGETILTKYTLYYLDENGDRTSKKYRRATILQNCGKVKFTTNEFFHKFTHGDSP